MGRFSYTAAYVARIKAFPVQHLDIAAFAQAERTLQGQNPLAAYQRLAEEAQAPYTPKASLGMPRASGRRKPVGARPA